MCEVREEEPLLGSGHMYAVLAKTCTVLKALSIQQPHADEVLLGGKDVENRTWRLPSGMKGQSIYVHAGLKPRPGYRGSKDRLGAILGEVTIVDCVETSDSPWFEGPYGFVLRDPVAYAEAHPWRGRLGFFEVSEA